MKTPLALAPIALLALVPVSTAAPEAWAGQGWEHDDYVAADPVSTLHASCDSAVGVATLVHDTGTWHFVIADTGCLGYNDDVADAQCSTDASGTLQCAHSDANGSVYTLSLTAAGHATADYYSHAAFSGDHYHVEADLTRAA